MKYKKAYDGKRIFIVKLLRWGDRENHSYLVGSYSTYEKALEMAERAMLARSGKYDAEIYEDIMDTHHMDLYRVIRWGDFDINKYNEDEK